MTNCSKDEVMLSVEGMTTEFTTPTGVVRAIDDISFQVRRGEVLGLVGESGSGKSVTGYSIMGLVDPPGRVAKGRILLNGQDIGGLSEEGQRQVRGNRIAMIFQDPMSSLHPMLTIGTQMMDAIRAHRRLPRKEAYDLARNALARVGIPAPTDRMKAYPHEMSGGMRQRVSIAIALLNDPDIIIADEPTTGLDVTIQAQILYEMQKLVAETGTGLLWITHDLSVVSGFGDRVAVMYAGRIVEEGAIADVIDHPSHPYTAGLLASAPSRNTGQKYLHQIPGTIAGAHAITGCRFMPRCSFARVECSRQPDFVAVSADQKAACVIAAEFKQREAEHA